MLKNNITNIFIVLLCFTSENDGQDISCSISKTSNCDKGLVPLIDFFTVSCTLDKSVAGKPTRAEFFVGSNTNTECVVPLSLCRGIQNLDCNCVDNASTYTVHLNRTAVFKYNQTEIKLIWGTSYGSVVTDIVEERGNAKCTLNEKPIKDDECPFKIAKGTGTRVNYTCNSALSPVMTYISFNNTDYEGSSSVVIDPPESGVGEYIFSSKICGITVHSDSCNAVLDSEPKTTCDDSCLIIVGVIVGVVVLVIIVGGIIVTLCVCWKWKNKTKTPKPKPRKHVTCENQV